MKFSVSVPDELWALVHRDSSGPSETVQRALSLLADHLRGAGRPLANAPDQGNLDRYREPFESAVKAAAEGFAAALDNGYRLGLLLASGMTGSDLEVLDDPHVAEDLNEIVNCWGLVLDFGLDLESLSFDFAESVGALLKDYDQKEGVNERNHSLLHEVLGEEFNAAAGVRWLDDNSDGIYWPHLSETYVRGMTSALRDVRDEAQRRASVIDRAEEAT